MKTPKQILCWFVGHSPRGMMGAGLCIRCSRPTGMPYYRDGRKWTDRERYGVIVMLWRWLFTWT